MNQQSKAGQQQLQHAFEQFNDLSEQLQGTYQSLQDRVASLTRELYAARSDRIRQLTEKEQLAARLGTLLDALPGGVIVLDSDGRICECNPAAEAFFERKLVGSNWTDIVPNPVHGQDMHELTLVTGRIVSLSRRPLESEGGTILLLQDVTETRTLQLQLARQERLSALGEMMARLAHQIRTPLATALLDASHLDQPQLSPEQRTDSKQRLQNCLHHLDEMVNDMLVFSRGGRCGEESVSVLALLEQVRTQLAGRLQSCQADWQVIARQADISLVCNRAALVGALSNLAANALHAGGEQPSLTWTLENNAGTVRLSLRDNGPGIPETVSAQIFEPFFTTRSNGTGLGLTVVRAVIEAHSGRVMVDHSVPSGACFRIELPSAVPSRHLPSDLRQHNFNSKRRSA